MKAVAKLKNCPMSARKMRQIVDNIRGKNVDHALNVLKFTKKEAGTWLEKLLLSAINNWGHKAGVDPDEYDLYVETAFVDEGTMLKRWQPAPHGRAHRIRKRSNHVTIIVSNRVAIDADLEGEENAYEEITEEES